jgi:hypothetical protein
MYQSTKESRNNSYGWCCYSFMFVVVIGGWGGSSAQLACLANDYGTVFAHGPTVLCNDCQISNDATDTPTSTRNNSITMTPIEEALAAIESRKPEDDLVYQEYADWFGVNRVTLAQRHQGCQSS